MAVNTAEQTTRIDYASTLSGRSKAVIMASVLLGLLLAAIDQTIVATALPQIVADLNGLDLIGWVTTAYLLASTTMVPIYGKLSDLYGRKIVLLSGVLIFLAGSALCGLAPSMLALVVFRAVQGLGAAALTSTAFAIPADLFVPSERARYQGIFGAVFGLASVIGPYTGGLLTDTIGWRWVFYINLPLGLLVIAFIVAKMPRLHSGLRSRIDYIGAALLVVTVVPLLLGLTLDKTIHPWTSPTIIGLFVVAAIGMVLFVLVERRSPAPIIPFRLFRIRTFSLLVPISLLTGSTFFAAILFLSLYLVNVLGVSSTTAGTALIPLTLGMVVSSIASSMIVQRLGRYKALVIFGFLIVIAGFWWMTQLDTTTTLNEIRLRMVVLGLGLGPTLPILNLALQNAVPFEDVGAATASRQFFQQLGQMIGAAVFGAVLTTTLTQTLTTRLTPIREQLPPEFASQFDPSQLQQGGVEGTGERVSVQERIEERVKQDFATQRELLTKALRDHDPAATQALLSDTRTPPQLRMLLQEGDVPPQALAQVSVGLDAAEQAALTKASTLGRQIDDAIKSAFVVSVTRIYGYALPLAVLAFVIMLFVPELPLRRNNRESTPVPFD